MSSALFIYTIYEHPLDYPEGYVVRKWEIGHVNSFPGEAKKAKTLDDARKLIPEGLYRIDRRPDDDPVIVECWL